MDYLVDVLVPDLRGEVLKYLGERDMANLLAVPKYQAVYGDLIEKYISSFPYVEIDKLKGEGMALKATHGDVLTLKRWIELRIANQQGQNIIWAEFLTKLPHIIFGAARGGHDDMVNWLFLNTTKYIPTFHTCVFCAETRDTPENHFWRHVLFGAAQGGKCELLNLALSYSNHKDRDQALSHVITGKQPQLLLSLLQAGLTDYHRAIKVACGSFDGKDLDSNKRLTYIGGVGDIECIRWILTAKHKYEIHDNNIKYYIEIAAAAGHLDIVALLITSRKVSTRIHFGNPAFEGAVSGNHLKIIDWCYDNKIAVLTEPRYIMLFLTMCAERGHLEILQWLFAHVSPDILIASNLQIVFSIACNCDHQNITKWLLTTSYAATTITRITPTTITINSTTPNISAAACKCKGRKH